MALETIRQRAQQHPTPLGLSAEYLVEGLQVCLECNSVEFDGKFYIPCRGCAQGTCHVCHFTDLWIGDITEKHIIKSEASTEKFSIYRDDGKDIIDESDVEEYTQQVNSLHPNLNWEVRSGREGGHLDLWIMIKDGKIEWRNYGKTPPLYIHRTSCHDPVITRNIHKGVGQRLTMNSSKEEYFDESVEEFSQALTQGMITNDQCGRSISSVIKIV